MSHETMPFRHDWISKTLAGVVLGFVLGIACSALFGELTQNMVPGSRYQLMMWLVMPVWVVALSTVYLFRNGLRAWGWLLLANAVIIMLTLITHHL